MTPSAMRSPHEEGELARSLRRRSRLSAVWVLGALLELLPLGGCGQPGEGTVQVAPESRHRGTDQATKVKPGVNPAKLQDPSAPTEPGKLGPGRGRASL
jgi:hypothetical protein